MSIPTPAFKSRYANTGLRKAEALFEAAHDRAGQYLDQAPILVMWAHPWASHSSRGAANFAKLWIAGLCEQGVGLKQFLRAAGFSAPMRDVKPTLILPSRAPLYQMLARMEPTVLARVMPTTVKAQRSWMAALDAWSTRWRGGDRFRDGDRLFQWCAENFDGVTPDQAKDITDFQDGRDARFNTDWKLPRAREEMAAWHARITLESQLRGMPFDADSNIDLGQHVDRFEVEPYLLTALRTPRQIAEEGSAMRHCVATYIKRVFDGHSHIISITKDGQRVATVDLGGPKAGKAQWAVAQIRGPLNSPVSPAVNSLAMLFSQVMRDRARELSS